MKGEWKWGFDDRRHRMEGFPAYRGIQERIHR